MTLKAYLEAEKGLKVYSPRDVIKEAFRVSLIGDEPEWLKMIETRNLTSHVYLEDMAERVYASLSKYLPLLKNLARDLMDQAQ